MASITTGCSHNLEQTNHLITVSTIGCDTVLVAMDCASLPTMPQADRTLLALPTEIRIAILEYVFNESLHLDGFKNHGRHGGTVIDEGYSTNDYLQPLLTCRQMYKDGSLLALNRMSFVISNVFFQVPERLSLLHPKQVAAVRNIAFVADARHFRKLVDWGQCPFDMPNLQLDTLTIVLHRSSFWHYLFDFTRGIAYLLRRLQGVRRLVIVRNSALVKGSFKTWYNRLVGLIMKVDHHERYDQIPSNLEKVWWEWSYDAVAQSASFEARPARPMMGEEPYMQLMRPLVEALKICVENEEWNPDPRSWNGT